MSIVQTNKFIPLPPMQDQNQQTSQQLKKWEWQECRQSVRTTSLYDSQLNEENDANARNQNSNQGVLKAPNQEDDQSFHIFNLDPSIVLTNPLKNGEEEPELELQIEMERNFLIDESGHWTWHKSWNLPNISITLVLKDRETGEVLLPPPNLYAKIFAVKKDSQLPNGLDIHHQISNPELLLSDVGLKGNEEKILVNSYAIFSGLKFKTTSYNHEGAPFYLVITIYYGSLNEYNKKDEAQEEGNQGGDNNEAQKEKTDANGQANPQENGSIIVQQNGTSLPPLGVPKVLLTKISPPLYINSRKLAKESSSKKYHTVIEPFDLQAVDQDLFIRSSKIHRIPFTGTVSNPITPLTQQQLNQSQNQSSMQSNEEKITSDIIGLINYFSAPNIRNKIRHPLFLALKFHEAVKIYYNPKKCGEIDQKSLAVRLHKDLQQEFSFGSMTNAQIQALNENKDSQLLSNNFNDMGSSQNRNVKFICFIDIEDHRQLGQNQVEYRPRDSEEVKKEESVANPSDSRFDQLDGSIDDIHYNEEFRKRLIENNFDLMNGSTIQVVTDIDQIPKYFVHLDNLASLKVAVANDLDGNNLNLLLSQTKKRNERDEISNMFQNTEDDVGNTANINRYIANQSQNLQISQQTSIQQDPTKTSQQQPQQFYAPQVQLTDQQQIALQQQQKRTLPQYGNVQGFLPTQINQYGGVQPIVVIQNPPPQLQQQQQNIQVIQKVDSSQQPKQQNNDLQGQTIIQPQPNQTVIQTQVANQIPYGMIQPGAQIITHPINVIQQQPQANIQGTQLHSQQAVYYTNPQQVQRMMIVPNQGFAYPQMTIAPQGTQFIAGNQMIPQAFNIQPYPQTIIQPSYIQAGQIPGLAQASYTSLQPGMQYGTVGQLAGQQQPATMSPMIINVQNQQQQPKTGQN